MGILISSRISDDIILGLNDFTKKNSLTKRVVLEEALINFKEKMKIKEMKKNKIINKKKFLETFQKIQFNSGEKNLSQNIDKILYER